MTEVFENEDVVRVRAQVMCRDEGTGGWMAAGGGGLADILVGRIRLRSDVPIETTPKVKVQTHEYFIHGTRISDSAMILECTVRKDFQYNKVMPTFHHWVADGKRFGLTFQTAADARAFDRGIRMAMEGLALGLGESWPSLHAYKDKKQRGEDRDYDEEHHIFECLNLPCSSRSSSENSAGRYHRSDTQTPILCAIALPTHHGESIKYDAVYHRGMEDKLGETDPDRYPYVHLSAVHEYTYPQMGPGGIITSEKSSPNTKPPLLKRDSGSIKKYSSPPPLPKKPIDTFQARFKCRHCHEWYSERENRRGSCEFAPDCFKSCIDCVTCIKCAQCMLYHCMSDAEGDFSMHPCTCGPPEEHCYKRWFAVTLLSVLVPCLCCYAPLRCSHRAAARARLAGGLHAPMN